MAYGFKSGGRKAGTPNKRSQEDREAAKAGGELPLEHMLRRMRDPTVDDDIRDEMAKAAAPYLHAKLTSEDAGMHVNIHGEAGNGHDKSAENHGILVQFVTPRKHVDE